jgi:hydroxyacylglutathione hydrolase
MSHICLLSRTEVPALFSGDTLFNAGVGHCHSGVDPDVLAHTVMTQMAELLDNTLLYPGHDYMVNNLRFTLDREPHNAAAQQLLQQVEFQDPNHALITNLGLEKQINTFFRTDSAEIRENLSQLNASATPKDVFLALRQHRNSW